VQGKITSAELKDERYKKLHLPFSLSAFTNQIGSLAKQIRSRRKITLSNKTVPCQYKQENRNSEVSRGHVDPDVEREWRQKRKQVWRFLHRLLVQNAHS
jgi:hypothetical protein